MNTGILGLWYQKSLFSQEIWLQKPMHRSLMVESLLKKHSLEGMNKNQVIDLLGNPSDSEFFTKGKSISYFLGHSGWIALDGDWLVIEFDENGRAISVEIIQG